MRRIKRTTWCSWVLGLAAVAVLGSACGGSGGSGGDEGGGGIPPLHPWAQGLGLTPVERYGTLEVCTVDGKPRICSEDGEPVQLRGMSLFWSNTGWGAERFYGAGAVNSLADSWNATVVRAAIGAQGGGSYTSDADANLDRARAVIDAAIAKGMYVIVDWHSHGAGATDLTEMTTQAQGFFRTLVEEYGDLPNLLWEPFNEPPGSTYSWAQVKAYSEAVITTIRTTPRAGGTGSPNLVIVGSPNWSQDVDVAASSPIADPNVAYTLHFYANTHGASLQSKGNTAMSRGVALFVTEYGTCDASGNGGFNALATKDWFAWMDANLISSANWSLHDKDETASALTPGAGDSGPWGASEVTESGLLVLDYIHRGFRNPIAVTPAGAGTGTVASSPAGIDCGATCTATFSAATQVTLTATPAAGGTFTGWTGACTGTAPCVVTMEEARAVTATFDAPAPPPPATAR